MRSHIVYTRIFGGKIWAFLLTFVDISTKHFKKFFYYAIKKNFFIVTNFSIVEKLRDHKNFYGHNFLFFPRPFTKIEKVTFICHFFIFPKHFWLKKVKKLKLTENLLYCSILEVCKRYMITLLVPYILLSFI